MLPSSKRTVMWKLSGMPIVGAKVRKPRVKTRVGARVEEPDGEIERVDAVVHRVAAASAPGRVASSASRLPRHVRRTRVTCSTRSRPIVPAAISRRDLGIDRLEARRLPDHQRHAVPLGRRDHRVEIGEGERGGLLDMDRFARAPPPR